MLTEEILQLWIVCYCKRVLLLLLLSLLLLLLLLLLKCFTLQNKAYHKTKTEDDTYNIADTNKKNDY